MSTFNKPFKRHRIQQLIAFIIAIIAIGTFAGWHFESWALNSILPNAVAMNPFTAVLFLLLSIAIWFVNGQRKSSFVIAMSVSFAVTVLALSQTLSLFGIDFQLDQILFRDSLDKTTQEFPNRMAPNTAANFLLLGLALLLHQRRSDSYSNFASQTFTFIAILISLMVLTGYVYNAASLTGLKEYIPMALNTAIAFSLSCIAILHAQEGKGFLSLFSSGHQGGWPLKVILPILGLIPLSFGLLFLKGLETQVFGIQTGIALFAVSTATVLVILFLVCAHFFNKQNHKLHINYDLSRSILDCMDNGVVTFNAQGECTLLNPAAKDILGIAPRSNELPNWIFKTNLFNQDNSQESPLSRAFNGISTHKHEFILRQPDQNEEKVVEASIRPLVYQNKTPQEALIVFRDITEKKRNENFMLSQNKELTAKNTQLYAQNIYSAKMASLGEISAGMAHEINNPLTIIIGKLDEILESIHSNEFQSNEAVGALKASKQAVIRISKIIRSLRSFSRDVSNDPTEAVPVRQVFKDIQELCQERLRFKGISLIFDSIPDDLYVNARSSEMLQIILNLVSNAQDTLASVDGDRWIRISAQQVENRIEISVSDSGPGVPKEKKEKIFQPFFSTKEPGKGTGLGLSITKQLVDQYGGQIFINEDHPFTCFTVSLPAINADEAFIAPSSSYKG